MITRGRTKMCTIKNIWNDKECEKIKARGRDETSWRFYKNRNNTFVKRLWQCLFFYKFRACGTLNTMMAISKPSFNLDLCHTYKFECYNIRLCSFFCFIHFVTLPNYGTPIGATEKPSIRQCACLLFGKFRPIEKTYWKLLKHMRFTFLLGFYSSHHPPFLETFVQLFLADKMFKN
jgi:hypothetical protein